MKEPHIYLPLTEDEQGAILNSLRDSLINDLHEGRNVSELYKLLVKVSQASDKNSRSVKRGDPAHEAR